MSHRAKVVLYWAPRVLSLLFAAFLSVFALDVFEEGRGLGETLVGLVIHLVPTWIVLAVLFVSWRREWIAGVVFPALGAFYVIEAWDKPFGTWSTFAVIAGPPVVVGLLFLLNWRWRAELRPGP